jgi:hypothetical protein
MAKLVEYPGSLGGLRLEVRCKLESTWQAMKPVLETVISKFAPWVEVHAVHRTAILHQAAIAFAGATGAGLFRATGGMQSIAPELKPLMYYMLLASLGFGHKYWNRKAFRLANQPWIAPLEGGLPMG